MVKYIVAYDRGKHRVIANKGGQLRRFIKKSEAKRFASTLKGNARVSKLDE